MSNQKQMMNIFSGLNFYKFKIEKRILSIISAEISTDHFGSANNLKPDLIKSACKILHKNQKNFILVIDIGLLEINKQDAEFFQTKCRKAIESKLNLKSLEIILTAEKSAQNQHTEKKITQQSSAENEKHLSAQPNQNAASIKGVKNVIVVASGKGGVGKSTAAVNLALSLNRLGLNIGLVDADIYGPSIAHIMNLQGQPKIENNLMLPIKSYGIDCISVASLLGNKKALAWRGPMITKTLHQLIHGTKWEEIDYLMIDMPPGTGDIHLSMAQKFPITGVVIISTPQDIAVIDAERSIDMFKKLNIPILGVIQNMAYLRDKNQDNEKIYLFGENKAKKMAEEWQINFLGEVPIDIEIRQSIDEGNPIVISKPGSDISLNYGMIAENVIDQVKKISGNSGNNY